MTTFRSVAVHIALMAIMLRAVLPIGWMPSPDGAARQAPIVICTADGAQLLHRDTSDPAQPAPSSAHEICIFAAAGPLIDGPVQSFALAFLNYESAGYMPHPAAGFLALRQTGAGGPRAPPGGAIL